MKKIFSSLVAATVIILATAGFSHAQGKNSQSFNKLSNTSTSVKKLTSIEGVDEVKSSEVSLKAQSDFSKTFKGARNVKWYKVDDGFIADFSEKGISKRSNYSKNGNWKYDIMTYTEESLPSDVHFQVKSQYYDYSITLVNEIRTAEGKMHIVHLTDKNSWMNLLVSGDDMEVIEQSVKSK